MSLVFVPMSAETAEQFRAGGTDAYGNAPERHISDGSGLPCRRCMKMVGADEPYLLFAWRPFRATHAFAETGPIFLHAETCAPDADSASLPPFLDSPDYILRGYDHEERIVYGTGAVIARDNIIDHASQLLSEPRVVSVHIRSARNNCYHCRVVSG